MTYRATDGLFRTTALMLTGLLAVAALSGVIAGRCIAGEEASGAENDDPLHKELKGQLATEHFKDGLKYMSKGETDEAIKSFELTIKADPSSYNTRLLLAKMYTANRRASEAEWTLMDAIKVRPEDPRAYDLLISLLLFRDKADRAVKIGELALKNGVSDKALLDLGWAYYMAGMFDKAEERYKRELEFREDIYATYRNLGILYFCTGRYNDSLEYYNKAEEVSGKVEDVPFLIAITLEAMGNKEEAAIQVAEFKNRYQKNYTERANTILDRMFPNTEIPDMRPYVFSYDPEKVRKRNERNK